MPQPRDSQPEADDEADAVPTAHDVEVDAEFTLDIAEAATEEALDS